MRRDPALGRATFNSQQLNNPVNDDENQIFPLKQFRSRPHEDIRKIPMVYYTTTVDAAEVVTDDSDYTVICTCGWDSYGRCYPVEIKHGKYKDDEIVTQTFDTCKRWRPQSIKIEETGYIRGKKTAFDRLQHLSGVYLPLIFTKRDNQASKMERIKSTLQPWYARGEIIFDQSIPCLDHLQHELTSFPKGRTDDIIDALADQFQDKEWSGRECDRSTSTGEQFENEMKRDEADYRRKLQELMKKAMDRKIKGEPGGNLGASSQESQDSWFWSTGAL
jgi:predicted phage terminase large subunit-like protein